MQKWLIGTLFLAGTALLTAGPSPACHDERARPEEIRIFVFDKNWKPVDVNTWTGALDVTPMNGLPQAFKLDLASPSPAENAGPQHGLKGEAGPTSMAQRESHPVLCGQIVKMEDWKVEMVVIRPDEAQQKNTRGKADVAPDSQGFAHDHGVTYFWARIENGALTNPKSGTINFKAMVVFTMPRGETKYLKGFNYPEGVIGDVLDRFMEHSFKDTATMGHEEAITLAHKIRRNLNAIPPLSFKREVDREDYDRACEECRAASMHLERAEPKDVPDAAEKCKAALKDVQAQARDSQGALAVD